MAHLDVQDVMVPSRPVKRGARLFGGIRTALGASAGAYLAAAAISIVAAIFLLGLGKADLRVPFNYGGDALFYSSIVKAVVDHGWFWSNPSLGAPAGLQLYDYPNVAHETLHLFVIKLMSVCSGDWALLINVYFLLGFPLIALSAMAVFRRCGVGRGAALVGGVLYSFLPSRLIKGEGHLFLDVFFQVPLAVLMLLWVCSDNPPLLRTPRDKAAPDLASAQRRRRMVAALVICGLSVCTSAYYSFFTACLLVAAGIWTSIDRRSGRNAIAGLTLAAAIVAGMAANGLPSIIHHRRHGPNAAVGLRGAGEAEFFGLRMTELLLPADEHRVTELRRLKQRYIAGAPRIGDSTTALGVIGDVGFLALLGVVFLRRRFERRPDTPFPSLAALNLSAVLIATIGGLGSLFALLVQAQIRAYSRIAVFIGFFALFAVVLLLERLKRWRPWAGALALPTVLIVGLLDQTPRSATRPYTQVKKAFASDRDLVRSIEARVPPGTMIFALPYLIFPEAPPVVHMVSYDLLRPYLHSSTLRWSLPTMHGRSGEAFVREVSAYAPEKMLDTIAAVGYGGILINRDGYADDGAAVEAGLRVALGSAPLVSENGRLLFFDLADYRHRLHADLSPDEIERVIHPIAVSFGKGFYGPEPEPTASARWCMRTGEIGIDNESAVARRVSISMKVAPARPPAHLTIGGDLLSGTVDLGETTEFAREVDVPPGHHVLHISSDSQPADIPGDARRMVWRLDRFALHDK